MGRDPRSRARRRGQSPRARRRHAAGARPNVEIVDWYGGVQRRARHRSTRQLIRRCTDRRPARSSGHAAGARAERRTVLDWSDEHKMLRDAIRTFVEKEIVPLHGELEHGDLAPYGVLRKLFASFGIDELARDGFKKRLERDTARRTTSSEVEADSPAAGFDPALMLILLIELSRYCPGMVTALGVSAGLTASAIESRGTPRQRERWVPDLLTLDRIGAWALTEPGSGSDAFGAMRAHARRDGDDYILNGSKTFITNGPYADTVVFICKLDEGNPA